MGEREYICVIWVSLFMIILTGVVEADRAANRDLLRYCINQHQPAECRAMVYGAVK